MRNRIIFALFFLLYLTGNQSVEAQNSNKNRLIRLEVPNGTAENFHLAPMRQNGLLVFYETNKLNADGTRLWYFALFDAEMKQKWLHQVALSDKLYFVGQKLSGGAVYLVFKNSARIKKGTGYYDILVYNIKKQTFRSVKGSLPLKVEIAGFAVQDKELALGLNLGDHKADLLVVNTISGNIKASHLNDLQDVAVDGVFRNGSNKTFVVVASSRDAKSAVKHVIYSFHTNGSPAGKVDITYFEPMTRLDNFVLADASGQQMKFFGAYHLMTRGGFVSGNNAGDDPNTEGLFYLSIENGKQKALRYFSFMDFKNIQGTFLQSDFHKAKIKKSKTSNELPGTVSLLNITRPEIYHQNKGYVVAVNAYVAYYKTESHMDYDFYGNIYPTDYRVFAGYRFYDVILAGFTGDGKIIWDNDFPMNNILSYKIENKALVYPDSSAITLAYVTAGQIVTQDISGSRKLDPLEKVNIASRYTRDRPAGGGTNKIIHWYGNYFLVYGYQQLKNRALQNQPLRTVFYINKVAFQ